MIKIGSIARYELEPIYSQERKNKIDDYKILLWISNIFYRDIQKGFLKQNQLTQENIIKSIETIKHTKQLQIKPILI